MLLILMLVIGFFLGLGLGFSIANKIVDDALREGLAAAEREARLDERFKVMDNQMLDALRRRQARLEAGMPLAEVDRLWQKEGGL